MPFLQVNQNVEHQVKKMAVTRFEEAKEVVASIFKFTVYVVFEKLFLERGC